MGASSRFFLLTVLIAGELIAASCGAPLLPAPSRLRTNSEQTLTGGNGDKRGVDPTTGRPPVVFWASDPINPDETALLFGDSLGKTAAYGDRVPDGGVSAPPVHAYTPPRFAGEPLRVLQLSNECSKTLLPADWKPGLYRLQLREPGASTGDIWLNRAEPWWWLADAGHTAHPGGDLRVFGKNFGPNSRVWLTAGGRSYELRVTKPEKYAVACTIPAEVPAGDYSLWVHNGFGGEAGFGKPLAVSIKPATPWPTKIFNVEDYNAVGDSTTDSSDAIQAALDAAKRNGGGIVSIPAGVYKITHKLSVPVRTIVRGAGRDVTWLMVPHEAPEFDAVVAGNADFTIEDLAIVAQTTRRLIVCPDHPDSYGGQGYAAAQSLGHHATLLSLRLQHLWFAHRVGNDRHDTRRAESTGPTTVFLAGADMTIAGCDIVSAGIPTKLMYATHCVVEDSRLDTGRNGWYDFEDMEECAFEKNTIEARDLEGSYGGIQRKTYRLYVANNRFADAYGDEREALTFDTPYKPTWMGVATASGWRCVQLRADPGQHWQPNTFVGQQFAVAAGPGVGERALVVASNDGTLTLDHPLPVKPTDKSLAACLINKSDVVITGNEIFDASVAVQLYSMATNFIIDGNKADRTGGMYGIGWDFMGADGRRFSPCWFNEWLGNTLDNSFIYEQGPSTLGGLGPYAIISKEEFPAMPILGTVIRGNNSLTRTTIGVDWNHRDNPGAIAARDTIIEHNLIADTPRAIALSQATTDTVLRQNQIMRSALPIEDTATATWQDPTEALRLQIDASAFVLGNLIDTSDLRGQLSAHSTPNVPELRNALLTRVERALHHRHFASAAAVANVDRLLETLLGLDIHVDTPVRETEGHGTTTLSVTIRPHLIGGASPLEIAFKSNEGHATAMRRLVSGDGFAYTIRGISEVDPKITILIRMPDEAYEFDRPIAVSTAVNDRN